MIWVKTQVRHLLNKYDRFGNQNATLHTNDLILITTGVLHYCRKDPRTSNMSQSVPS